MKFAILLSLLPTLLLAQSCSRDFFPLTFKFGRLNGTVLSDGPIYGANGFFNNIPQSAYARSARENFYPFPAMFSQNILVLDTPSGRFMFDTGAFSAINAGFPGFEDAGQLIENLRIAGISRDSIDAILITHGHFDHVGGLIDRRGRRLFKNAKVYISRAEHEYWTADPFINLSALDDSFANILPATYKRAIMPYKRNGKLVFVNANASPFPGIKFLSTPGHAVGHMSIQVASAGKRLIFTGDSVLTRVDQIQNPTWSLVVETNNTQAYDTRVRLMDRASDQKILLLDYHERFPGLGYVKKVGAAFDWVEAGRKELKIGTRQTC